MSVKRVALIFDNTSRPETTGLYCRRALGNLVEVEHFLPDEVEQLVQGQGGLGGKFDLFLNVDDGHRDHLPASLHPSAYWAIDTHMDFDWALQKSGEFDFVFAAQRDGAERLRQAGIETAQWLPLACDPELHCRLREDSGDRPAEDRSRGNDDFGKRFDVCFVGNLFPGPRSELIALIQQRFSNTFVGRRYLLDMSATYTASRIVFNRSVKNDVNMRVFEALACGSLLVTNELNDNGQERLFQDGVHLATYACAEELIDKLAFYLEHDQARETIASNGRGEVHSRHTYLHRMSHLLRTVERGLSKQVFGVPTAFPLDGSEPSTPTAPTRGQVSACLVSWKRPENVRRIVEQLRSEPLIDDILVWNNDPHTRLSFDGEDVRVIQSDENRVTYGRYLCARQARHDVIYTQDDDCLVHNMTELYESFCLDPDVLTHNLKLGHLARNAENVYEDAQMGLVGWGAFFKKDWVEVFDHYREVYGEDELLWRKADRIFTVLLGRRHRALPAEISDLPGASGSEALSVLEDHFELTRQAVSRAMSLLNQPGPGSSPPVPQGAAPAESSENQAPASEPTTGGTKDHSYFGFNRPEVVALVPRSARRVLDIGCGAGRLGEALKQRQPVEVTGIELNAAAATAARRRLDEVHVVNVEDQEIDFPAGHFDCVICADVLEHLRDPARVLKMIRRWLEPGGLLVASLPNVRHHSVVRSLLAGNWTYESAGLLDDDHVRFFTRREIQKLFFRAGFIIPDLQVVPGPGYREWEQQGRPGEVRIGRLHLQGLASEDAEEFYVYQYLVAARPENERPASQITGNVLERAMGDVDQADNIEALRRSAPWPAARPNVALPTQNTGWLGDGSRAALAQVLSGKTKLVVELGAWLGTSTRFMADRAPQATVISIDHWEGSPEHRTRPAWREMLPALYETFLAMCWNDRARIIPLRMTTLEGLQQIADQGLLPDVIYFDAEHSYEAVRSELELCAQLFPHAILVGDDYEVPGVASAVHELATRRNLNVQIEGTKWKSWSINPQLPEVGGMSPPSESGLTSIIIVTHNQLDYTKSCVDSIRQFTDEAYELIFVDNGSTDGTPGYLRALGDVTLIENEENRGFPAAVNQGLQAARGRQILLLNNDVIVTTGWLRRLLAALDSDPQIGLVGPCTNNVSGPQQVPVDYDELAELDGFAWDWGRDHDGGRLDAERLVGFCLLIRREVVDEVGLFDERFGIGNFEDDDYCRRAISGGYRTVIARDAFVHHFGSATFRSSGVDFAGLLQENQRLYDDKWQQLEAAAQEPAEGNGTPELPMTETTGDGKYRIEQHPQGGLLLKAANPVPHAVRAVGSPCKLSLCMIVRDNAGTIRACLEGIRPWVDEIVVVDTGSQDSTPEIVQEYGVRLFEFPWCDDFSAARNESLRQAQGEWIFWMDSDDTIDAANGRQLRELADGAHDADCFGYTMQVHCPGPPEDGHVAFTAVDHVKLFRNRPDLRFEGRIHEQIIPAIRRAGGQVAFTELFVVHSGSDHSPDSRARKLERDFRILHRELEEKPDHTFVLFNLGMTYADADRHEEAIGYLERSISVAQPAESHVRKAYALLVSSLSQAGRHDAAWESCQRGLALFPDDKELLFRSGMLHHHFERFDAAVQAYLSVLNREEDRHFSSVDSGIAGYKARHNLAIVYEDTRAFDKAEQQWRAIVAEQPAYRPGWRGWGESLLKQGRLDDARRLAEDLLANGNLRTEGAVLKAHIAEQQHDYGAARQCLEAAIAEQPDEREPLRELCRILFEQGLSVEALQALQQLTHNDPDDASAHHNLATVLLGLQRPNEAVQEYRASLKLRPKSAATCLFLGNALQECGQMPRAVSAWKQAWRLDPGNESAQQALQQARSVAGSQNVSDLATPH